MDIDQLARSFVIHGYITSNNQKLYKPIYEDTHLVNGYITSSEVVQTHLLQCAEDNRARLSKRTAPTK